jgi:hypothetical protein
VQTCYWQEMVPSNACPNTQQQRLDLDAMMTSIVQQVCQTVSVRGEIKEINLLNVLAGSNIFKQLYKIPLHLSTLFSMHVLVLQHKQVAIEIIVLHDG